MWTWKKAKDPSEMQIKIELFYGVWIFLLEACWLIYGNTFIYTEEIKVCHDHNSLFGWDVSSERLTTLVLIIYGYFLLAGILFFILFYTGLYFGYKSYTQLDQEALLNQDGDGQNQL